MALFLTRHKNWWGGWRYWWGEGENNIHYLLKHLNINWRQGPSSTYTFNVGITLIFFNEWNSSLKRQTPWLQFHTPKFSTEDLISLSILLYLPLSVYTLLAINFTCHRPLWVCWKSWTIFPRKTHIQTLRFSYTTLPKGWVIRHHGLYLLFWEN